VSVSLAKQATACLQKYFSFPQFRPGQEAIVTSILQGQDTLAVLPTGGGKSICFQVPALLFPGTTIVISPLISLMTDQVEHLLAKNISATFLNSQLSREERKSRLLQLEQGKYRFLYLAPESLANTQLIQICQKIKIPLFVVDEAHCASIWGQQFRPSYQKIPEFIQKIQKNGQKIIRAAFTATATPQVKAEIIQILALRQAKIFAHSFLRENLFFQNIACRSLYDKNLLLFKILKLHPKRPAIIYCSTRLACEELLALLNTFQFAVQRQIDIYHGGLAKEKRQNVQSAFLAKKLDLIIATNAFGMGVDKDDIALVIHYQVSASLENYYQEAGRAGRNGEAGFCYLLYSDHDLEIQKQLLQKSYPEPRSPQQEQRWQIEIRKLQAMKNYARSQSCLEAKIDHYFSEKSLHRGYCQHCAICQQTFLQLNTKERNIYKKLAQFNQKYFQKVEYPKPALLLTSKQMETLAVLQPSCSEELALLPGIAPFISQRAEFYRPIVEICRPK
jgi:ATP-dependent DNA helicase RecQ